MKSLRSLLSLALTLPLLALNSAKSSLAIGEDKHKDYYERIHQKKMLKGMSITDADAYVIGVRRNVQSVMRTSGLDESKAISIVANTSEKIFFRTEVV